MNVNDVYALTKVVTVPTTNQKPHPSGQVVAVRLDAQTIKRLDALAELTDRNRSAYLREAIEEMLPELEKRYGDQRLRKSLGL